jgi:hypothetical protein
LTAHLSEPQILAYRDRSLTGAELLSLSEHVRECDQCRERIGTPEQLARGVRAIRDRLRGEAATFHLNYEEIAGYADETIGDGDREGVEAHLGECQTCASDVAAMRMLRSELEGSRRERSKSNLWLGALWGWRGGFALAAAACIVLGVIVLRGPLARNRTVARVGKANSSAGAVIDDGSRIFSVATGGRISGLDALPELDRAFIERVLAGQPIEPGPSLRDLAGRTSVLLGGPAEVGQGKLIGPLATVVESQRPFFRWQPIPGAVYRVSVFNTAYDKVAGSEWIAESEWQVAQSLRRGERYSWQIRVRQNGTEFIAPAPPAPEARFRILGEAEEAEISRARVQWSNSHLVAGLLYARAGLLDDATKELRALNEQNPGSAEVAGLLASVERLRGGK